MKKENYKTQIIVSGEYALKEVSGILADLKAKHVLAVCSRSAIRHYGVEFLEEFSGDITFFHEFSSNPRYEEVEEGIAVFEKEQCDTIVSLGGGSAMDVAKCIKLFATMDKNFNYLQQEKKQNQIRHIAIPTTAGTGSESTSFAVIYYQGEKQSVAHESILPDYAILHAGFLEKLPLYQKRATVLDALCQGIESYWSVNSTEESKQYAAKAIQGIKEHLESYIFENKGWEQIMLAANQAGRAINISRTTAAHAMSYKITSFYQFAHGHAVALCLPETWKYMSEHLERCIDTRGKAYLEQVLEELNQLLGKKDTASAIAWFLNVIDKMELEYPVQNKQEELEILVSSVNVERLSNFPVQLEAKDLREMYQEILKTSDTLE
ncbi:MAG: phosphonoacetaldehyde reductase [Lachnospiraceae bacterium]